jgi:predicted flap endonuclease-1-like 5' DNA nuclease
MKNLYQKISVLVLGLFWILISARTFSLLIPSPRIGWEFFVIILGSFALGWIAYYVWYAETSALHTDTKTKQSTVGEVQLQNMLQKSNDVTPTKAAVITTPVTVVIRDIAVDDDLKVIEGIGPKIEELFKAAGLDTFQKVSEASAERMSEILTDAGPRFQFNNPKTWAEQARLAAEGKWQELEAMQANLIGGL